ncbi:MAG: hypothetical protein ACREYC_12375, partial [Gammaproteobacteria bacterium]
MLAQNPVTGQLYEVPDSQPYGTGYAEAPMMYDGLGNPVGWAFLAPLAAKLAPLAAKALPYAAKYLTPLARRVLPGRAAGGIAPRFAQQAAQAAWGGRPLAAQAFAPAVGPVPYVPAPMPSSIEEEYGQYGQYAPPGPMQMPPQPMAPAAPSMPGQFP